MIQSHKILLTTRIMSYFIFTYTHTRVFITVFTDLRFINVPTIIIFCSVCTSICVKLMFAEKKQSEKSSFKF